MEKIFLHKNGVITKKGKKTITSVLKLLGNTIEIDEIFTLGSFFAMVKKYPDLKNISEILEPLLEIILKNRGSEFKTEELESLLFYKIIEIKGFPGSPNLNFYTNLKGVVGKEILDLKFFHLENLLDLKLKLGKLKHVVFGDREDAFQYETFYTLFEFVEGIAWELSFNFNPLECSIRR
ncbi:MAG: hypothetical protein HOG03_11020 [Desulfobacula sp.]|jgi:hypothetical protein|uniref:hypothetical protein n=1 Tax=Desulfobacula sp. TaxID=2593537 RepID=UPI001DE52822|nr:hypothetical protein [Desulfobacula sp.]MBT3486708.1 hypothetical protein [Desulfobacula sp.]MBT3805114.1 hypothetical protein [Desulfobacula sp.]MBT4026032.1 hypothetical protein [Desulfobacula sp.]MBT4199789.1 hypothetical protein [Desulfobacula sp.]